MSEVYSWVEQLEARQKQIETRLREYCATMPSQIPATMSANGTQALQLLADFMLRPAKRIRGVLGMVAYEMFGGTDRSAALDLAVCLELAQAYLLVIDDVMDHSDQRRGGMALHRQYEDVLKTYDAKDAEHTSEMLACTVGLVAQHLAGKLLNGLLLAPERVLRAMDLYQSNMLVTSLGQLDDLFDASGRPVDEAHVRNKYVQKTSYYTFINPLQMGAALAGASDADLEPLRAYGEQAGLVFQISDDLIGMYGDPEQSGKSAMDDLREGKVTLLIQAAFTRATPEQEAVLRAAWGNREATPEQHKAVLVVLDATGAATYTKEQAAVAAKAAQGTLETLGGSTDGGRFLASLLEYIVERKK